MNPSCHQSRERAVIRSSAQLQKLSIKRVFPKSLEFNLKETLTSAQFRRTTRYLSKCPPKLKNPPMKQLLNNFKLSKNTKVLTIKPDDARSNMKKICVNFTRLEQLFISDPEHSFSPMKMQGRARPIRSLKTFCHDHELCQEFMTCARYVTSLKIKKSSLNLVTFKQFKHLQTLYLIFKARYVSFEYDDKKFVNNLARVINKNLLALNKIVLEHEIDSESHTFIPLQLYHALGGRVRMDLVADLIDISNQRNPQNSIEKILKEISSAGIQHINFNYVGAMKNVRKFDRWFHVPIHSRKELYTKFLKNLQVSDFQWAQFTPIVHSSHMNFELKDSLLTLNKLGSRVSIPKITLVYSLDTIEENVFNLLLDVYDCNIPSFELVVMNTMNLTQEKCDELDHHYEKMLAKIQHSNMEFSLSVIACDYHNLITLLQMLIPKDNFSIFKSLSIKVINPISKYNLKGLSKMLTKSTAWRSLRKFEVSFSQKDTPTSQDIYEMVDSILQKNSKIQKVAFLRQNSDEHIEVINDAFDRLRKERSGIDLKYDVSNDKSFIYE